MSEMRMRIAVVHSFYRSASPSGENEVVVNEVEALRARGHHVRLIARQSDEIRGPIAVLRTGVSVANWSGHDPTEALRSFRPEIVHVNNLFPGFGHEWLRSWTGPVAATLHNYRPICSAATLTRNGDECHECLEFGTWSAVRHGCYRGSRIATLPLAWRSRKGLAADPLIQRADGIIVLSERMRETYTREGLTSERIRLIPNGAPDRPLRSQPRSGWLFAGRLSPEKGIVELLGDWPAATPLDIVGTGPLDSEIRSACSRLPEVRLLGALPHEELCRRMGRYSGMVLPRRRREGMPMVLVESLRAGTPVLAREGTSASDFVSSVGGGATYLTRADLHQSVSTWGSFTSPQDAREVFTSFLSSEVWGKSLESFFLRLLNRSGSA